MGHLPLHLLCHKSSKFCPLKCRTRWPLYREWHFPHIHLGAVIVTALEVLQGRLQGNCHSSHLVCSQVTSFLKPRSATWMLGQHPKAGSVALGTMENALLVAIPHSNTVWRNLSQASFPYMWQWSSRWSETSIQHDQVECFLGPDHLKLFQGIGGNSGPSRSGLCRIVSGGWGYMADPVNNLHGHLCPSQEALHHLHLGEAVLANGLGSQ